nr:aminotransferase class V-fold PLP-dependent enzyme [Pantoea ananatis]
MNFVAIVHCETTTGVLNQLNDIAKLVKSLNRKLIVDAISSFGAVPIDFIQTPITALVFSSNKGLESVPGLAFVLVEIEHIRKCEGLSNSISLDLFDQWKEFESSGQWRFTPPVQVMLALNTALDYLEKEGGIEKRHKRYSENAQKIISGMKNLGFQSYVRPELQSPVIVTFLLEDVLPFNFIELYNYLYSNNLVIYPGKLTKLNSFRIGCIGQITDKDIKRLIFFIKKFLLLKN